MSNPLISCKCITYGRTNLLEEAVHSFLIQEYNGPKELIIVNDYPLQTLIFNHPEVKVINTDTTFPTIGHKENFALEQCSGDIIAVWDDDDIAMPNHLSNIAKYFTPGSNILHWQKGVYYNEPAITAITGLGNSGVVYSKSGWEKVGKHPFENAGYDTTFINKLHKLGGVVNAAPPDHEVSWWYMWGGRDYHMSGLGADVKGKPNVLQRHAAHIEKKRVKGEIPTGDVYLNPRWHKDYQQMLKDFIKNKR